MVHPFKDPLHIFPNPSPLFLRRIPVWWLTNSLRWLRPALFNRPPGLGVSLALSDAPIMRAKLLATLQNVNGKILVDPDQH